MLFMQKLDLYAASMNVIHTLTVTSRHCESASLQKKVVLKLHRCVCSDCDSVWHRRQLVSHAFISQRAEDIS